MKYLLSGIVAILFAAVVVPILGVLTMIYGWGLEPQNWWWIVGGYAGLVLGSFITAMLKELIKY